MPESDKTWRAGGAEIGRSIFAVALSMIAFVVSLLALLVALLLFDGVAWPVVIGVFCGFAAATVLNATDIIARWSRWDRTGGEGNTGRRDDQRENGRVR